MSGSPRHIILYFERVLNQNLIKSQLCPQAGIGQGLFPARLSNELSTYGKLYLVSFIWKIMEKGFDKGNNI